MGKFRDSLKSSLDTLREMEEELKQTYHLRYEVENGFQKVTFFNKSLMIFASEGCGYTRKQALLNAIKNMHPVDAQLAVLFKEV